MKMSTNKVFLDFHIFDIPEGEEFVLIGRPIEPLVNPNGDRTTLEVKVGKEKIPVSLVRSCNTIAEAMWHCWGYLTTRINLKAFN